MTTNGVLLDLVAHGAQDIFLIGNPQLTYFKSVYKRHTNFALGTIIAPIDGAFNFGARVSVTVPRSGDLMHTVLLEVDLPAISSIPTAPIGGDPNDYVNGQGVIQWINNIGHGLIQRIELKIGEQLIDTQYGEWMEIWTQLSQDEGEKRGMDAMILRSPYSNDGPSSLNLTGPLTARIPFQFWFCRNIGLSLPLVALQYHDVVFDIYFNPLNMLYTNGPYDYYTASGTNGSSTLNIVKLSGQPSRDLNLSDNGKIIVITSNNTSYYIDPTTPITGTGTTIDPFVVTLATPLTATITSVEVYIKPNGILSGTPVMTDARMFVDMVYLDTFELREFAQQNHRYLIDQVQYRSSDSIVGQTNNIKFPVKFNLSMKELFWVLQLDSVSRDNDLFNYSNTVNSTSVRGDIMTDCLIQFNGIDRFPHRDGVYFRTVIPKQKHTRTPLDFFYMYSFGISPEEFQPNGATNFSKIDAIDMIMSIAPGLSSINFRCYGLSNNILRIMNGMGGIAFSN